MEVCRRCKEAECHQSNANKDTIPCADIQSLQDDSEAEQMHRAFAEIPLNTPTQGQAHDHPAWLSHTSVKR